MVVVGFASDEAIEILKAAAAAGPTVERPHQTGFPHRHLVASAELSRGVAIQLENIRHRRASVRAQEVVCRSRVSHHGDRPKANRVMLAAAEQGRSTLVMCADLVFLQQRSALRVLGTNTKGMVGDVRRIDEEGEDRRPGLMATAIGRAKPRGQGPLAGNVRPGCSTSSMPPPAIRMLWVMTSPPTCSGLRMRRQRCRRRAPAHRPDHRPAAGAGGAGHGRPWPS